MINKEKMSKSTGNFLTVADARDEYGADPCRFALADAGDGLEDANFEQSVANAAVLRLYTQLEYLKEVCGQLPELRTGPMDTFADRAFLNEIYRAVRQTEAHYENLEFRGALKTGFYELQACRDVYREVASATGSMHRDLIMYVSMGGGAQRSQGGHRPCGAESRACRGNAVSVDTRGCIVSL
jgi:leucyl-tRNA synthetase